MIIPRWSAAAAFEFPVDPAPLFDYIHRHPAGNRDRRGADAFPGCEGKAGAGYVSIAALLTATGSDNPFNGASVMTCFTFDDIAVILAALKFSAQKHRDQRRKDAVQTPYINHPIEVADLLWRVGNVHDLRALVAALLHDIIEDTETSPGEIERSFGGEVLSLVLEVSDDKRLPKAIRKSLQIRHAPNLSLHAKAIKLADKICNTLDITHSPPHDWPVERRLEYLDWTEKVVAGLRGGNAALESFYDRVLAEGRAIVDRAGGSGE